MGNVETIAVANENSADFDDLDIDEQPVQHSA